MTDSIENRRKIKNELIPLLMVTLNEQSEDHESIARSYRYYARKYLNVKSQNLSTSSMQKYNRINENICLVLGDKLIDKIKVSEIGDYIYQQSYSAKTLQDYISIMNGTFQQAIYDEVISSNPVAHIEKPKVVKKRIRPFDKTEIVLLLNNAKGWFRNYIAVAFYTGMRSGELCGLQWKDINFDDNTLDIKRSRHHGIDGPTKTVGSRRTIPIFSVLKPYLLAQYEITGKYNTYVFMTNKNKPLTDTGRINSTIWTELLKTSDIPYRRLYQLRHTFATTMLASGKFSVNMISDMMGHTSVQMLFTVYAKYIKGEAKKIDSNVDILNV